MGRRTELALVKMMVLELGSSKETQSEYRLAGKWAFVLETQLDST